MWHEKKVIAWLLRDLTISRVHMQYKRLSPMPWYLPKARSLGIHRIHRPLYGANDRLIVVDTIDLRYTFQKRTRSRRSPRSSPAATTSTILPASSRSSRIAATDSPGSGQRMNAAAL